MKRQQRSHGTARVNEDLAHLQRIEFKRLQANANLQRAISDKVELHCGNAALRPRNLPLVWQAETKRGSQLARRPAISIQFIVVCTTCKYRRESKRGRCKMASGSFRRKRLDVNAGASREQQ
jgi:hypothetical protein